MDSFAISGMTCSGCANKVQDALRALSPGVSVTLDPPRANQLGVTEQVANAALANIGKYRVTAVPMDPPALAAAPARPASANPLPAVKVYYPLALVLGLIAMAALAAESWMMAFMAGFYLVFGAFKLLDLPGFATAYARYDVIAERLPIWGYAYPFVELGLGFAFLFHVQMGLAIWATLILSLMGAIGVIRSLARRETIQCACLGTVFNLPMSTVTVVENLGMAAMAALMLTTGM